MSKRTAGQVLMATGAVLVWAGYFAALPLLNVDSMLASMATGMCVVGVIAALIGGFLMTKEPNQ